MPGTAEAAHPRPSTVDPAVLIVEDHVDTAELLRLWLAKRKLSAAIASDAPSAIEWLSRQRPRCLIVDDSLPGPSGVHLLRQIKERSDLQALPVIFYSATYDDGRVRDAATLGAEAWFVKGVSRPQDLMGRVERCCSTIGPPGLPPLA